MVKKRDTWGRSFEFFLSLVGYAVGPGNLLRFPYLTLRNGGGAFLIPYFLSLFVCGIPLTLVEMYMGQSAHGSCLSCWNKLGPIWKGAGYCMMILSTCYVVYSQTAMSWVLYYIYSSFTTTLPWTSCNQTWNTQNCMSTVNDNWNISGNSSVFNGTMMSSTEEFWQYHVLQISEGIGHVGIPSWKLCICHFIGIIIMYLCLFKGVKSAGKVVWVTATAPYVLLVIFLVRAALLPGSMKGIMFYLTPKFEVLTNPEPWILGFAQIFYSLALGHGGFVTMASHNKQSHKFYYEAFLMPIAVCMTSFVGGFIVFSCAGFLSLKSGLPVENVTSAGPGLAFVSYPEVISHLPGAPIWSILFFLMLLLVIIDSLFMGIEVNVCSIVDEFGIDGKRYHIVLGIFVSLNFFLGLLFLSNGGMYYYQLLDWYYPIIGSFAVTMIELITLVWIYGYERIRLDFEIMLGKRLVKWPIIVIGGVLLPLILFSVMTFSLHSLTKPVYGNYHYPDWCGVFGWCIALMITLPIPIYAVVRMLLLWGESNKFHRLKVLFRPEVLISQNGIDDIQKDHMSYSDCEV